MTVTLTVCEWLTNCESDPDRTPGVDVTAQLKELMEMRNAGGLTEEEFQAAKRKLLA